MTFYQLISNKQTYHKQLIMSNLDVKFLQVTGEIWAQSKKSVYLLQHWSTALFVTVSDLDSYL